ncbi:glutamine---fructose-6-phosphate transaminase (isomerizing) [Pancytospora philotis]|nr:glutamine---fructose-6-phosphate transaminase (isomerizing) [Pancytospora philotis]
MCGIYALANFAGTIGIGSMNVLLGRGMKQLEYRGKDSVGFSVVADNEFVIYEKIPGDDCVDKAVAFLNAYKEEARAEPWKSLMALGHSRWATKGVVSNANTHPHLSDDSKLFQVAMNGVVENYGAMKAEIAEADSSVTYYGETDTEIFAKYVLHLHRAGEAASDSGARSFLDLASEAGRKCQGKFAYIATSRLYPDQMVGYTKQMSLYVGLGDQDYEDRVEECTEDGATTYVHRIATESKHYELSSDFIGFSDRVKKYITLSFGDIVLVSGAGLEIVTTNAKGLTADDFTYNPGLFSTGAYKTHTEKEMREQPRVLAKIIKRFVKEDGELDFSVLSPKLIEQLSSDEIKRFFFVGTGSSYHAAMMIADAVNELFDGVTLTATAYDSNILKEKKNFLSTRNRDGSYRQDSASFILSQSGSTCDTIGAMEYCKAQNSLTIAICNAENKPIPIGCVETIPINAGVELAVASTKATTSQYLIGALLGAFIATKRGVGKERVEAFVKGLGELEEALEKTLAITTKETQDGKLKLTNLQGKRIKPLPLMKYINKFSKNPRKPHAALALVSRGTTHAVAMEARLKGVEITYIPFSCYHAGSFMHGPLALCDSNFGIVAIEPADQKLHEVFAGSIDKPIANHTAPFVICSSNSKNLEKYKTAGIAGIIVVPAVHQLLHPILMTVVCQMMAFEIGFEKLKLKVDKPRNLAKSVTVE